MIGIDNSTAVTNMVYVGLAQDSIKRMEDAGEKRPIVRDSKFQEMLKDKEGIVPQVYREEEDGIKQDNENHQEGIIKDLKGERRFLQSFREYNNEGKTEEYTDSGEHIDLTI